MAFSDSLKFTALVVKESWKRFSSYIRRQSFFGLFSSRPTPERLIIAPQDLRTIDPSAAIEIYSGRYFLAGQMVELNGADPFTLEQVSYSWQCELHKFQWLRHLEGAQTNLSQNNAQVLIRDWMSAHDKPRKSIAWQEEIAAYRLISWLCHSVPIVENASNQFYKSWLKSIGGHIRFLKQCANDAPDGMPKLVTKIALAYASICVSGQSLYLRNAVSSLNAELDRQILADGGHITRNAANLPILLSLLLPLRQSFIKLDLEPSQTLITSIDRMMAALKFHRLGDANFARFNGVSTTPSDLNATILRYDDAKGKPANEAVSSGYQRITKKDTTLIADVGKQPTSQLSDKAHAGTLSFEFTDGAFPIVVNCGLPFSENLALQYACRTTAAHSTAGINDESSSIIYRNEKYNLGGKIVSGPTNVFYEREENTDNTTLKMGHNGYFPRFGLIHHRFLGVSENGEKILGEDKFLGESEKPIKGKTPLEFCIRFHLHPTLSAGKTENGRSILIMGGKGIAWKFTCVDVLPQLEESNFFASLSGPRRARQIVLKGNARELSNLRWIFEKQLKAKPKQKSAQSQNLPLD